MVSIVLSFIECAGFFFFFRVVFVVVAALFLCLSSFVPLSRRFGAQLLLQKIVFSPCTCKRSIYQKQVNIFFGCISLMDVKGQCRAFKRLVYKAGDIDDRRSKSREGDRMCGGKF